MTGTARFDDPVGRFLVAVTVILFVCHLLGGLAVRCRQPRVVGEILGGLLLGPSALGVLWPGGHGWLFSGTSLQALEMAAQLGLVTFMFLVGTRLRGEGGEAAPGRVAWVVAGGMGLPFAAGLLFALLAPDLLAGSARAAFPVFLGLALSITAVPVLARVVSELSLDGTPAARLALASAAIGDGVAWGGLTVLLAISLGESASAAVVLGLTLALIAVTVLVTGPALAALIRRMEHRAGPAHLVPVLVAGVTAYAATTQLIGLHPVIGAVLFGAALPPDSALVRRLSEQLSGFVLIVLLPLFFVGVGLHTSVAGLGSGATPWLVFAALLLAATAAKLLGTALGARLAGLRGRDPLALGVLMNCRGVTEIVVASVGLQYGLINDAGLTVLVLVALVTTALTAPLFRLAAGRRRAAADRVSGPVEGPVDDPAGQPAPARP